jgi:hypothetical protein
MLWYQPDRKAGAVRTQPANWTTAQDKRKEINPAIDFALVITARHTSHPDSIFPDAFKSRALIRPGPY